MKMSSKISSFFVFTFLFSLISCTQASKNEVVKQPPMSYLEQRAALPPPVPLDGATPLTIEGDNFSPFLSRDENQLLFVSKNRIQHKHPQIYILDFTTQKERRLTWNDGITSNPRFDSTQKSFLYSSNTDEIKETPAILKKISTNGNAYSDESVKMGLHSNLENSEIYLSTLDGQDIHRLTDRRGFDGYLNRINKGFIYLSVYKESFQIQSAHLISNTLNNLKVLHRSSSPISDLTTSDDSKFVSWIRIDPANSLSQLVTTSLQDFNPRFINLPEGYYRDPVWLNKKDTMIISAKLKDKPDFDIYFADLSKTCIIPIIQYPGDDVTPTVNLKNTFVIFSHISDSNQHLFKKSIDLTSVQCN